MSRIITDDAWREFVAMLIENQDGTVSWDIETVQGIHDSILVRLLDRPPRRDGRRYMIIPPPWFVHAPELRVEEGL